MSWFKIHSIHPILFITQTNYLHINFRPHNPYRITKIIFNKRNPKVSHYAVTSRFYSVSKKLVSNTIIPLTRKSKLEIIKKIMLLMENSVKFKKRLKISPGF